MVGIGMLVGGEGSPSPDLEVTLVRASVEGMDHGDLRVLAVLVTWFGVHSERVSADRLTRLVPLEESMRAHAFWSALARWRWQAADRRFAGLARGYRARRIDLLTTGTEFQVARQGEDRRFAGSKLRVPAKVLRNRPADVLTPAELAMSHAAHRWRLGADGGSPSRPRRP
jgi:hypothetical protein